MRILWGEGVVLPCGGVGEWVASGNKELTEEGVFVVFCLYGCTSGVFNGVKVLLN